MACCDTTLDRGKEIRRAFVSIHLDLEDDD
jgi:hypothetical protein